MTRPLIVAPGGFLCRGADLWEQQLAGRLDVLVGSNVLPAGRAAAGIADKLVFNDDRRILDELRPYPLHRLCAVRADRSLKVLNGASDIFDHSELLCSRENASTIYAGQV